MESRHVEGVEITQEPETAAGPSRSDKPGSQSSGKYHPSILLRRALKRRSKENSQSHTEPSAESLAGPIPGYAPPMASLLGAALALGALSGFLEMGVQAFQLHALHRVDWSSLMFNRHYAWLCVVVSTIATTSVTLLFMAPACAWAAWRKSRGAAATRFYWTWDFAGVTLGSLVFLGPLQAIHGFHPVAPLALAVGAGFQLRHCFVRRSPSWARRCRKVGIVAIVLVPSYAFWQWHRVMSAPLAAWSQPSSSAPNLIFIVLDTLRADHMSTYGYERPTTPELDAWAKKGVTFDMARSAAALDFALARDHVHRALAVAARRAGRPALLRGGSDAGGTPPFQGLRHRRRGRQRPHVQPRSTASGAASTPTSTIPGTRKSRSRPR